MRDTLVVFGGRGNGDFGDTWLFDLGAHAWREVKSPAPEARFGHAVVYDGANRRMLLAMGQGETFFNDVWAFDLEHETWIRLSANGAGDDKPRPRYGQSAVLDARGRVIVSHGFSDQGRFDDTWAFDPATNRWTNLTPASGAKPLRRCLHELAYDPASDRVVLFGGCSSGFGPCPQGDLWAFDLKSNGWTELKPEGSKPSARDNPSLVYDQSAKRLVLFGGRAEAGPTAETWTYDLAANRWTQAPGAGSAAPSARRSHESDYDPKGGRVLLFGGTGVDGPRNDIWEWK